MLALSPESLAAWLRDPVRSAPLLLDVREPWEFDICHLDGARLVPMGHVPVQIDTLDPDAEIVVICHHGMRSAQVAYFLESRGFSNVMNLTGGMSAWALQVDPEMAQY